MSTSGDELARLQQLLKSANEVSFSQKYSDLTQLEGSSQTFPDQLPPPAPMSLPPLPMAGHPLPPAKRERYERALNYDMGSFISQNYLPHKHAKLSDNARQIEGVLRGICEFSETDDQQKLEEESIQAFKPGPERVGLRRSDLFQIRKYQIVAHNLPKLATSFESFRPEQLNQLLNRAKPQTPAKAPVSSGKKIMACKEFPAVTRVGKQRGVTKTVSEKMEHLMMKRVWGHLMKRDIPKAAKAMGKQRGDIRLNAKKFSGFASKEVQKKANKMQREAKEANTRAKKLQREMVSFWRRREKETADMKRKRDREELEARKKREEEEEAQRQRKRLEYIMRQSDIYSHFMAQKLGIQHTQANVKSMYVEEEVANENVKKMIREQREHINKFQKTEIPNDDLTQIGLTGLDKVDQNRIFSRIEGPPQSFVGQLKDYQMKGLKWLDNLYDQGINGILADEMGLGKTIQTIALLAHLSFNKNIWGPFLIVCPSSTLHNWQMELKKFCPSLKVIPYWGHIKERKGLRRYMHNRKLGYQQAPFHACVTSYQYIISDQKYFQKIMWKYMILDQAHAIKNPTTQRWNILLNFNARNKLLLTGTPIQNSMAELWALLHFIMPKLFDSHQHFQEWFSKDIQAHSQDTGSLNQHQLQRLHAILKPFMLRRVKKDVQREIGPKTEYEYFCQLSNRQRVLYHRIKSKLNISEFFSMADSKVKVENLMNLMMQFRKVCNHPDLFERRPEHAPFVFGDLMYRGFQMKPGFNQLVEVRSGNKNPISYQIPRLVYQQYYSSKKFPSIYSAEFSLIFRLVGLTYTEGIKLLFSDDLTRGILALHYYTRYKRLSRYQGWKQPLLLPSYQHTSLKVKLSDYPRSVIFYSPNTIARPINFYSSSIHFQSYYYGSLNSCYLKQIIQGANFRPAYSWFAEGNSSGVPPPELNIELPCYIDLPSVERLLQDSAKLNLLDRILKELHSGGHRVLIFCQMTKMLDILQEHLYYRQYSFLRMDGSTQISDRKHLINQFQTNSSIFVFVLSTRAGGLGVNLTAADTVIFYDIDWNPTMDAQATDRVHRIGQNKPVAVYRLITSSTVEERILKRARQKQTVQSTVYAGGAFKADDIFKPQEVMELLFDEKDLDKMAQTQKFMGVSKRGKKKTEKGEEFNITEFVENEISQDK